jgi:hypothetical protein
MDTPADRATITSTSLATSRRDSFDTGAFRISRSVHPAHWSFNVISPDEFHRLIEFSNTEETSEGAVTISVTNCHGTVTMVTRMDLAPEGKLRHPRVPERNDV